MATRLPASQHTREELTALIEGRLSTASAKDADLLPHAGKSVPRRSRVQRRLGRTCAWQHHLKEHVCSP